MDEPEAVATADLAAALARGQPALEALCALMWAVRCHPHLRHADGTGAAALAAAAWACRHAGALGQLDRLDLGEPALPHLVAELEDGFRAFREWRQAWELAVAAAGPALGPLAGAARALAQAAFAAWRDAAVAGAGQVGAGRWVDVARTLGILPEEEVGP